MPLDDPNSARRKGRPFRHFDQAEADRMLVRVAKGERWRRMLETDPSMPCRVVVYRWRFEEPLWDKALKIAFSVGRLARERARTRARCSTELSEEIGERIALDGGSLRRVAMEPDMPCARTLYRWKALFPEFAWTVADAYDFRDWMAADRALAASPFYEDMRRLMDAAAREEGRAGASP